MLHAVRNFKFCETLLSPVRHIPLTKNKTEFFSSGSKKEKVCKMNLLQQISFETTNDTFLKNER